MVIPGAFALVGLLALALYLERRRDRRAGLLRDRPPP
jgi:hypothetical protein